MTTLNERNQAKLDEMGGDFYEYTLGITETGGPEANIASIERRIAKVRAEITELANGHTLIREDESIPAEIKAQLEASVPKAMADKLATIEHYNTQIEDVRNLADSGLI